MNNNNTYSVDKEFILEAYEMACNEWKQKLKNKFPEAFPQDIKERIKTLEDVAGIVGRFEEVPFTYTGKSLTKEQKSINALMKLFKITEAYNEGWKADFDTPNQSKYFPYIYKGSDGGWSVLYCHWGSGCGIPSGLFFKSSELALDAIGKFREIYNDYFMVS